MSPSTVVVTLFFLAGIQGIHAQDNAMPTINQLSELLVKATDKDFLLTGDTVLQDKGGVNHWLVILKPRRIGFYSIMYSYKGQDGQGIKATYQISVGSAGDRRFVDYHDSRLIKQACKDIAVGDEIVVPFRMDDQATGLKFELTSESTQFFDAESYPYYLNFIKSDLLNRKVIGTVDELGCIGIKEVVSVHRGLKERTVKQYILFEAKKQGRFNVVVNDSVTVPVTILPERETIKSLAGYVHYTTSNASGTASSSGSSDFLLERAVLRIGDVLIICFNQEIVTGDQKSQSDPVNVGRSGFTLRNTGYDYWINR